MVEESEKTTINNNNNNISIINKDYKMTAMSTSQNILIRLSIILGMSAAVVTILYLTPMPDQNFKSCDRPCHELDWPMICRVKLNIEMYHTDNHICQGCRKNVSGTHSQCSNIFCQLNEESSPRSIITANRRIPGPPIQVCQNDILIVDVINKIPGKSVTLHWRGQPNHEAPFMDGVPMVTQCPIPSHTVFQYKFRASYAGTHFYHAFTDADRSNGLFGALIVRKAERVEPHKKLYDVDLKEHVVMISEWSGDFSHPSHTDPTQSTTLLINGKAPSERGSSLALFNIHPGKRHRFRAAYVSGTAGCPVTLTIDEHPVKVIALDGNPITPHEVTGVKLSKGERVDFVLKAGLSKGAYYMNVKSTCQETDLHGLAVVNYKSPEASFETDNKIDNAAPKNVEKTSRHFDTSLCESEVGKVCLANVKSLQKMPEELRKEEVDRKIFLEIDYKYDGKGSNNDGFTDLRPKTYRINNLTFAYPSSPLLTQPMDVPSSLICNEVLVPGTCKDDASICECVHLEDIPLGQSVEVIIIDKAGDEDEHVFHFHGNHFYIVGSRQFDRPMSRQEIVDLDEENDLVKRNLRNPVKKDTIRVPKYGVVVLRFLADNPGIWMLRDEKPRGWTKGLDMVFEVGDRHEMVSTPSNFPTCGNYIGPEFFLL
ncbi:laccase-like [Sitophilus oryzae]|uniref:Laccase-like n=1 Tax=Sitophilus oryzae TaxID=7048 RepID=A0A6J2YAV2_SITOR|nr:laccase-like [Sitophilus oryzae]